MGGFGSGLFGATGLSGSSSAAVGVLFSEIGMAAYRIAGITKWARVGPSADMWAECIPAYNRMVGSWQCERPKVFTIRLDTLSLPTSKVCTIGTGGDFDMPRPVAIQNGVVVLADQTRLQPPMVQGRAEDWARLSMQDVPGAHPRAFYYDNSVDSTTGLARVYLYPQAQGGLQVDWYTWQQLPTVATEGDQVAYPPEYEEAIVYKLAERLAALNPLIANMPEESRRIGRKALAALEAKNSRPPQMSSDYSTCRGGVSIEWIRTGGF
jgi:hypothetical protein